MNNLSDKFGKDANAKRLADNALRDKKVLSGMLDGLLSEKKTKNDHCGEVKYNCLKALWILGEENPEALYPEWDFFVKLFDDNNAYLRFLAVHVIANLTEVDTKNKFEKTFNMYLTSRLLNIDKVLKSKQKDLVGGYAIEAFSEYFEESEDKDMITEFVKKQLKSKSPRTRKKAKEFLEKWEK
ncbi:MAG: hypothetical protein A7315_05155 [Candidatus Altiarchaeales archaeon WOR_SM1_79]|nr:MAG: hypothetical protein A7315_05155 [Candidatus Altiarchaeales archaeon WOR_SM1_79]